MSLRSRAKDGIAPAMIEAKVVKVILQEQSKDSTLFYRNLYCVVSLDDIYFITADSNLLSSSLSSNVNDERNVSYDK